MRSTLHRKATVPIAFLAAAGLVLTGCSAEGGDEGAGGPGDYGEADGVVTIYGTIADTEADLLNESWADWEEENGIDIQYESSKEFEAQIGIRAQGGNAPDLAIFPQPGLLASVAETGAVLPAPAPVAATPGSVASTCRARIVADVAWLPAASVQVPFTVIPEAAVSDDSNKALSAFLASRSRCIASIRARNSASAAAGQTSSGSTPARCSTPEPSERRSGLGLVGDVDDDQEEEETPFPGVAPDPASAKSVEQKVVFEVLNASLAESSAGLLSSSSRSFAAGVPADLRLKPTLAAEGGSAVVRKGHRGCVFGSWNGGAIACPSFAQFHGGKPSRFEEVAATATVLRQP